MIRIHAASALLPRGWVADVRLVLRDGRLAEIDAGVAAEAGDERHAIVMPGMPNVHSHAHQRAMAGRAERRGPGTDDFWTWREAMYRSALAITPEDFETTSAYLFAEMLQAGFTHVGEFHYLHNDPAGRPYADRAEMSRRVLAAARRAGIRITLLPVHYARAGFDGAPAGPRQRRFTTDVDGYARLVETLRADVAGAGDGAVIGVAPHSLRAVTPAELREVVAIAGDAPLHVHVAEQLREVQECIASRGARPVQWLLDHAPVGAGWCLVHATHMEPSESRRVAASGAVVGVCPITEANLGDGVLDVRAYIDAGGRFGIGTDSNVQIGVADELRQMEYAQRLLHRRRNVLAAPGASCGRELLGRALAGGHAALAAGAVARGAPAGIQVGAPGDLVALRPSDPLARGRVGDDVLDAWIFAGSRCVDAVWVGGRRVVADGRHLLRESLEREFAAVVQRVGRD